MRVSKLQLIGGLAAGAAAIYLLDPARGRRRQDRGRGPGGSHVTCNRPRVGAGGGERDWMHGKLH